MTFDDLERLDIINTNLVIFREIEIEVYFKLYTVQNTKYKYAHYYMVYNSG